MTTGKKCKTVLRAKFLLIVAVLLSVAMLAACGGDGADYADSDGNGYSGGLAAAEATPSPSPATTPQPTPQPTPEPEPEPEAIPFLWLVTAPHGQTMYVFGTIHYGLPEWFPLPLELMRAFRRSDFIAVETPLDIMPDWTPYFDINDYLTPEQMEDFRLRAFANLVDYADYLYELTGLTLDDVYDFGFDELGGLAGAIVWAMSGTEHRYGMENFFAGLAITERGIPVLHIEDYREVHARVRGISPQLQIAQLEADLTMSISDSLDLRRVSMEAWRRNDEQTLLEVTIPGTFDLSDDDALNQEWRDIMLTYRDPQMADRASQWMAEGKKVFFMVGAAHLLGEGNVLDILAERGYQIERISY